MSMKSHFPFLGPLTPFSVFIVCTYDATKVIAAMKKSCYAIRAKREPRFSLSPAVQSRIELLAVQRLYSQFAENSLSTVHAIATNC
jgi:hypothetical protein